MKKWCLLLCLISQTAFAAKAHEHGVAKVDIALEGLSGVVHFESPASSIYGFEHEAKSAKDKATRDQKIELLKTKFAEMVIFDPKAGCTLKVTKIEPFVKEEHDEHDEHDEHEEHAKEEKSKSAKAAKPKKDKHHEATHSEVHAEFAVTCKAPVAGTEVTFGFLKHFAAIKKVKVQAVSGEKQNGAQINNDKGSVSL